MDKQTSHKSKENILNCDECSYKCQKKGKTKKYQNIFILKRKMKKNLYKILFGWINYSYQR